MQISRPSLLVLTACVTLSISSKARLGETKVEIETRYGEGISIKDPTVEEVVKELVYDGLGVRATDDLPRMEGYIYKKNNWVVTVVFLDGKSSTEEYFKGDSFTIKGDEISTFLTNNSCGKEWLPVKTVTADGKDVTDPNNRRWIQRDPPVGDKKPKTTAVTFLAGRKLTVVNTALLDYINETHANAAKKAQEQKDKALKDF